MMTNNICCYVDTELKGDKSTWHLTTDYANMYNPVKVVNLLDD